MSEWIAKTREDLSISYDGKELQVFVERDDFGARYVEIPLDDVISFLRTKGKV